MTSIKRIPCFVAIAFILAATCSNDNSINPKEWVDMSLPLFDQGFYISTGQRFEGDNYVAEWVGSTEWRNFFVFNLASVKKPIKSATLKLYAWTVYFDTKYTLQKYDMVDTNLKWLLSVNSSGQDSIGYSVFNDLGDGEVYAETLVKKTDSSKTISIPLNSACVAEMNKCDSLFVLGGKCIVDLTKDRGCIFGSSLSHESNKLELIFDQ